MIGLDYRSRLKAIPASKKQQLGYQPHDHRKQEEIHQAALLFVLLSHEPMPVVLLQLLHMLDECRVLGIR